MINIFYPTSCRTYPINHCSKVASHRDSPTPNNSSSPVCQFQRGKSGRLCCNWQWSAHAPFLLEATYTTPCQLWVILGQAFLDLLITPGPWCAAIARQFGRLERTTLAPFPGGLAGVILWEKESPFSGRKRSTVAKLSLYHFFYS